MAKTAKNEGIERMTLKLPKSIAEYFRAAFPHGRRSEFVADCLRRHRHEQEIYKIEEEMREVGKRRQ